MLRVAERIYDYGHLLICSHQKAIVEVSYQNLIKTYGSFANNQ